MSLLLLDLHALVARQAGHVRLQRADRAERAHLGHSPGMHDADVIAALEDVDDGARAGRAADHDALHVRQLAAGLLQVLQQHQPDRRHGRGDGDPLPVEQLVDRGAVQLRAGHDQRRPDHRRDEGERPGIGMEHRHHRHEPIVAGEAEHVGDAAGQCMQHVGAVGIDHALRVAGRAGGVAHAGGGVLVEVAPGEIVVRREPLLIGLNFERRRRHVRGVGQHDHPLDRRDAVADLLHDRQEARVDEEQPVLGIVDDPGDLLGEEARIDGVVDGAEAEQAVPDLHVAPMVPGERRGTLAELEPVRIEPLCHPERSRAQRPIVGAVNRPFDRARDDLALAMMLCRVIDQLVAKQRPILHQPAHRSLPFLGMDTPPSRLAWQAEAGDSTLRQKTSIGAKSCHLRGLSAKVWMS